MGVLFFMFLGLSYMKKRCNYYAKNIILSLIISDKQSLLYFNLNESLNFTKHFYPYYCAFITTEKAGEFSLSGKLHYGRTD